MRNNKTKKTGDNNMSIQEISPERGFAKGVALSLALDAYGKPTVGYVGRMNIILREADLVGKGSSSDTCNRLELSFRQEIQRRNYPEAIKRVILEKVHQLKVRANLAKGCVPCQN